MKKCVTTAAGVAGWALTAGLASGALAYDKGDMLLRFGVATVDPQTSTGELTSNGAEVPIGDDLVDVKAGTAAGISFTYMFTPLVGLELLAATPFSHDIDADGGLRQLGLDQIGTTRHLPPTLSVQYYPFGNADQPWQLYLGVGVNFTWFFDEELDSDTKAALGVDGADFSLKDSWGLAASVGFDWLFGEHWLVNASLMWADIDTEASIDNSVLGDLTVRDIQIDPLVYRINAGYRF